jgi:predicted NBD/HSP70 family sugar kinase
VLEFKNLGASVVCEPGIECDAALAHTIGQLASAKDRVAQETYSVLAGYLAEGVANLFNVLDPEAVIVSGGLVEGHPEFIADVESRVRRLLHFGDLRKPSVLLAAGGHQAGILGAAVAVFSCEAEAKA